MLYPIKRNLDGMYFRVEREGKFDDVCFTDLLPEEQEEILGEKSKEFAINVALRLADVLRDIGDMYDMEMTDGDDE